MKKSLIIITTVAALVACTKELEQPTPTQKTYYVSINANKTVNASQVASRALADAGSSLTATWTAGDEVDVQFGGASVGTLTAASDGANTKLAGAITGSFSKDDELELYYLSASYASQRGTLDEIASNCDYATATVTITDVSGDVLTISDADFANQQAITKFTLFKEDGTTPLNTYNMIITAAGLAGNKITLTTESYTNVKYVAMCNTSGEKQEYLFLITEAGTGTKYYATKKVNLVNGKYYETTLVAKGTVSSFYDLSESINTTYTLGGNELLYQSDPSVNNNIPLTVNNGYNVILFNVHVEVGYSNRTRSAMTCNGAATINLLGDNYLKGYDGSNMSSLGTAGIDAPGDPGLYTVTFSGPGNLTAIGGYGAAGIGAGALSGSSGHVHANLVFNGTGTITASSKQYGAGIGSGVMYNTGMSSTITNSIGNITINSGTIVASSSAGLAYSNISGAGIGSGAGYGSSSTKLARSSCGNITINGGHVTATAGKEGAGIGTGACAANYSYSLCGNIYINGGTVVATGGNQAAGIGASRGYALSYGTTCGAIDIGAGITSVTATRGLANENVQCIGRGWSNSSSVCGDITIDAGLTDSGEPGSGSGLTRTIIP